MGQTSVERHLWRRHLESKMAAPEMTSSKTWGGFLDPHWGRGGKWRPFRFRSPSWMTSFRKWGHPRWRPEAEGPPFSTSTSMGVQKTSLYYFGGFLLPIMLNFAEFIHILMTVPILLFVLASTWIFHVTISIVVFVKRTTKFYIHWGGQVVMVAASLLLVVALFVISKMITIDAAGDRGWQRCLLSTSETSYTTSEQLITMLSATLLFFRSPLILMCCDPLLQSTYCCFIQLTLSRITFSSLPCMLLWFGWPLCQQLDFTCVEVSQRAYNSLCIRDMWLFVYSWN